MTSPRLLLVAGSIAATLVGIGAVPGHTQSVASSPFTIGSQGVAVSVSQFRSGGAATVELVVPQGVSRLSGVASGSPALAARARLTVLRSSDGATLFTGSLATFRSLPVQAGTKLEVRVQKPVGFSGLKAGTELRWA
jgi:hypothetical protein